MVRRFVNGKNPAIQRSPDERSLFERRTQRTDRRDAHEEDDRRAERQSADQTGDHAGLLLSRCIGAFRFRPLPDAGAEVADEHDHGNDYADEAKTTGGLPGQLAGLREQLAGPSVNAVTGEEREDRAERLGQLARQAALPASDCAVHDIGRYEEIDEVHEAAAY